MRDHLPYCYDPNVIYVKAEAEQENIEIIKDTVDSLSTYHDKTLEELNDMLMSVVHDWSLTKDFLQQAESKAEREMEVLRK